MMIVKIKIKRSDRRARGRYQSYYQAYDVKVTGSMTVLEALMQIMERQDGTLTFRRSCRSAICGSCAVMINGFPKLACNTQILPEYKKRGEMIIEPLTNHTIIRDLVVDFGPFWKKMEKVTPYLSASTTSGGGRHMITKGDTATIDSVQKCIMCGSCNAACNALEIDEKYIAPAALAKSWRFVGDVREVGKKKRLGRLSEDHGMWECVRCVHCTQYCPKDVAPLKAIEQLRSEAMTAGMVDNHGAKHVESMVHSVKRVGRLDEAAMTFKTLGFLRSLGMIPYGLKMEIHGKMPLPILFPAIEGIEEVRKIYDEIEKWRESSKTKGTKE
jgi:succinate dehydrogenase / fumarate reductase iron-sulfur subunit